MSEKNRLLSDSTPERKIVTTKVGDQSRPVKASSAWNVDDTELQSVVTGPPESHIESLESTFISDVSPTHSKGSDKELLRVHNPSDKTKIRDDNPKMRSHTPEISPMRSTTPRSMDGRSQREKIKERIAAAKERVQATSQIKPKPLKKAKPPPEDDTVSKEDEEVEEAMKRHKIMRSRWKVASTGIHVAGIQSSLDFFSRSAEEKGQSPQHPRGFGAKSPAEEGASPKSGGSEEEKLLCAEVLGSKEDDWLPLFTYEPPQPENWEQLKQKQLGLFFCPSASPVPIEEKLEPDTVPRFIEEEGLYVGEKANIPLKRRNKLEQRIMAMGSERVWFGEDGEIKGIQDPLDFRRYREYKDDIIDYDLIECKPPEIKEEGKDEKSINLGGSYILELDIGAVAFKHHPLFSKEEVLGSRLATLVDTLSARSALVRRLAGRLTALRNFPSHSDAKRYKTELKEVRTAWLKEAKNEREVLSAILETWRDLKAQRSRQGYTVTSYRLVIAAREDPEHGRGWQREYDFYLQEMEDEGEAEYKLLMEEYQKKVAEWNQRRLHTDEADLGTTTDEDEPDKPQRKSKLKLKQRVSEDLGASLRPPGEPLVEVELKTDGTITTTVENNPQEHERRLVAGKTQLWVVLRHNDKEVDRVKTLQEPHFVYRASYRFCLRISKWPKSLALRLLEVGQPNLFGRKPIAEVFIPVPGRMNTDLAEWQDFEFSSNSTTGPLGHAAVGTDVNALCTGSISVRAGWALPLPQIVHVERSLKEPKSGKDNIKALKEWAEQVQLDPNDPTNADLLEYIKLCEEKEMLKKSLESGGKGLRRENPLDFCTEEELLSNPRLKLLMLRAAGQPEFRNMRNIPINEREIPKDIFKLYEKRTGGKDAKKSKGYFFDSIREAGKDFMDNVREEVFKACTQNHIKTFKEIVHEDPIPDLRTLGLTVMRWLQPKRPLRPRRKERKKLPVKGLVGQQLEIMVNIGRAFEVPVRKEAPATQTGTADEFSLVPVRPFIEVTFQDQRRRTTTADGPNPTWNQDIHIPVQCMGGIQNVRDSLFIHLYDEKVVDLVEDERARESTIVQRTERYWLGSLRIPFTALYSRIEGTFQLYSPPVLLGYKRESKDFRDSTFLTLFVMVHPPLTSPSSLQEKMASVEDAFIELHLDQWMMEVARAFPSRHIPALVLNSTGKTVCVTRFIRAIPPPGSDTILSSTQILHTQWLVPMELVAGEKTTPEMVARFVSLIPVIPNYQFFPGQMDIWLTAQEILDRCASEIPCRAALLACLLKYFFERTYLLVGTGVPGGPSAFVLTFPAAGSKGGPPTIWDPSTSQKHAPGDPFSPLASLHAIIDDTNIWVNLQKEELISQMNLDVTKRSSDWWPAFGRAVAAPTPSVQPEALEMKETPENEVKLLQDRLEKILRNAIMKLRSANRTIWNRYCTASLRKLLPGLEMNTWSAETTSPPDHIQELEHISSSYKMCGFPINLPYTGSSALVEAVKSTGVHLNDAPEMEFSAAVYVRPFPSNILSVWIYVASLIRVR